MFNKRAKKRKDKQMQNCVIGNFLPKPNAKRTGDKINISGWILLFRWIVIGYVVAVGAWLGLQAVTAIH